MNRLFFGLVLLVLLLSGCSNAPEKQTCYQREVKYTEGSATDCTEKQVETNVDGLKLTIEPRPTQADHQYDIGIMNFRFLNKDKNTNGYFNLSMDCVSAAGVTKERTTVFMAAGEVKPIELKCSQRAFFTELKGPFIDSAPMTTCPKSNAVEKVRYETVCE